MGNKKPTRKQRRALLVRGVPWDETKSEKKQSP